MNYNVKVIESNKMYALETDTIMSSDDVKHLLSIWEKSTGTKAVIVQGAKVKDTATLPVAELASLLRAIQRVRELHTSVQCTEDVECCQICDYCSQIYPCPTIKALEGEQ